MKVTRRGFFGAVAAIGVAAVARLSATVVQAVSGRRGLTYRGKPVLFDPNCPSNSIYFLNPETVHAWKMEAR